MKKLELKVYVDYDPETDTFANPKVFLEGVTEKVTKTRVKKEKVVKEESDQPLLSRESNKLVLNKALIDTLGVQPDDRISIRYEEVGKNKKVPVIGSDIYFGDKGNGNKLTKSNTIGFRGKSNEILEDFGSKFTVKPTDRNGVFFLVSLDTPEIPNENLDEIDAIAETVLDIETESDQEFNLTIDDFNI